MTLNQHEEDFYNQEPQFKTSAPRHDLMRRIYQLKTNLPQIVFLIIFIFCFLAVWGIFVYIFSCSFNIAFDIFSKIANGALLDQKVYVLFFQTSMAQVYANMFVLTLECSSLYLDFIVAGLEGKYLRTIFAHNIDEKKRREIKQNLRNEMLVKKLFLFLIVIGYSVLIFIGLGINLSSDIDVTSLSGNPLSSGQINIVHLPSNLWQRFVIGAFSIALGFCNMLLIPQMVVGVTQIFIAEVLQKQVKSEIWEDLDNFFKNKVQDLKNSDFWKNKK